MSAHVPSVPVARPGWPTQPPSQPRLEQGWPGYSYPHASGARVRAASRLSHRHVLAGLMGGLAGVVVVLIVISLLAQPSAPVGCTGLTCEIRPSSGPPVENGSLYTNPKFGFTARVLSGGLSTSVSTADDELTITFNANGGSLGQLQLAGQAADGQTAEQIVNAEINKIANGAELAYTIPGSMIGYQPGFGAAYNFDSTSSDGQSQTLRVIVMAAVRDNVAVVSVCFGALIQFGDGPGQPNDNHPSIADLLIAQTGDPILDSVLWPGQAVP
ncbi:MAG: hypothetical protein ACLP6E_10960 [Acidimicrobiales bacterium]